MNGPGHRRALAALAALLLVASTATVAGAAVEAEFDSSYDGYAVVGDDGDTDAPGKEIAVAGQVTFTGSNAEDIRIVVQPGDGVVVDRASVETFVEGGQAGAVEVTHEPDRIVLATDTVDAGTTIRVEFLAYPRNVEGVEEVTAATVSVRHTPVGGERQRDDYEVTTALENGPNDLVAEIESLRGVGPSLPLLFGIGVAGLLVGAGGAWGYLTVLREEDEEDEEGPRPPEEDDDGGPPGPPGRPGG